jgi:hypothetical protein
MFKFFKKSTIKVKLIEALDNDLIGEVNLSPSQLPQSFKTSTTMHIGDKDWQVVKAEPEDYSDFYKSGELTLWLRPVETIDPSLIRFSIPTISNELPGVSDSSPFNDFTLTLHEDNWRQIEFLPLSLLPVIQEEMADVEAIIFPEDDPDFNSLNGFDKVHVRRRIGEHHLSIELEAFCEKAGIIQRGNIAFQGYNVFVKNGFSLKGANYTWYGIAEENIIRDLAIDFFDSIDDEIMQILNHYDLLMVEWCRGSITGA